MRKFIQHLSIFILFSFNANAQVGLASYYADDFQGRETASGEKYDKNALTAAHKEFPFGSYIRVTRLDNGKSVVVKVNDRGPYFEGYVVDLSRRAAEAIDIIDIGVAKVKVELEKHPPKEKPVVRNIEIGNIPDEYDIPEKVKEKVASNETKPIEKVIYVDPKKDDSKDEFTSKGDEKSAAKKAKEIVKKKKPIKEKIVKSAPKKVEKLKTDAKAEDSSKSMPYLTNKNFQTYDLYKIELKRPKKMGYGVQIGTFALYENVLKQIAILQGKSFDNILVSIQKSSSGKTLYKVILGPFSERASAQHYKENAAKRYKIKGFVIDLSQIKFK